MRKTARKLFVDDEDIKSNSMPVEMNNSDNEDSNSDITIEDMSTSDTTTATSTSFSDSESDIFKNYYEGWTWSGP